MSYKVIHNFFDLQDNNHPYQVGDKFPRQGAVASENRLKELSGANNRQGKPLIEIVLDVPKCVVESSSTATAPGMSSL